MQSNSSSSFIPDVSGEFCYFDAAVGRNLGQLSSFPCTLQRVATGKPSFEVCF